ncbi:Rho guanine nucleotide exchange factor [Stygiomarasmius scandens]|uniref:Rho guanine nucleotide exchange factor n=1 Tax=Marasmiellus scandens TaxID=2682957 RepID=A0ABR1IRZ8_9AGAR
MIRLSKKSGLYPICLVLNNVRRVGDHPVAAGGFGEIWQGVIGDQIACLKVVKIYGDSDIRELLKEFFQEAIVWRQLDHPNVLPFLGLYFLDDSRQRVCLLSPWMNNGNLRQFLKNGSKVSIDRARLAHDIASGLSYLHEGKIIHGDLKGDNILITLAGRAVIADFGLARKVAESDILRLTSLSTSIHGKGSTRWMAPECLLPPISGSSFRSDIYAFGGVCYETFTGYIPFYETLQDITVVLQLMAGKRPSRPSDTPHLNDSMWTIMQECWSQEPAARPLANVLPDKIARAFDRIIESPGRWDDILSSRLRESIQLPDLGFHLEEFLSDSQSTLRGSKRVSRLHTNSQISTSVFDSTTLSRYSLGSDVGPVMNFSLLSVLSSQTTKRIPRRSHSKDAISHPNAFTGRDLVSTIRSLILRELSLNRNASVDENELAVQVARSLQSQSSFRQLDRDGLDSKKGADNVYMFVDILPTGVITSLTRCYSPMCAEGNLCYSPRCPRKKGVGRPKRTKTSPSSPKTVNTKASQVILLEKGAKLKAAIHDLISQEEQYIAEIDILDSVFIRPLYSVNPPIISPLKLDGFINDVFGNILNIRECNKRLVELLYTGQTELQIREEVFQDVTENVMLAYQKYIENYSPAEDRFKQEAAENVLLRLFVEERSRETQCSDDRSRWDLYYYLDRTLDHLQRQRPLFEALTKEVIVGSSDTGTLNKFIGALGDFQGMIRPRMFRRSMTSGDLGRSGWHNLSSEELNNGLEEREEKRQSIIFELIKGEMSYVKDLENTETVMYIGALRKATPPVVSPDQLDLLIEDVFHNLLDLLSHHKHLIEKLHDTQGKECLHTQNIAGVVFDAVLNFWDTYVKYIYNYPVAMHRLNDESAKNLKFKVLIDTIGHSNGLNINRLISRPIKHLLRYGLLLQEIFKETPPSHKDYDGLLQILQNIRILEDNIRPGLTAAKQKQELWFYSTNIVFKPGEWINLHLLDMDRCLVHTGKFLELRQSSVSLEWNEYRKIFTLLFDNYLVMTEVKRKGSHVQYHGKQRPLLLDLVTLSNFSNSPQQVSLKNPRGNSFEPESHIIYPCAIRYSGREGGQYILYTESAETRIEWKNKLEEALKSRRSTQEKNKAFEIRTLSKCFVSEDNVPAPAGSWSHGNTFVAKATCAVPFYTSNGQLLIAIGCVDGVWVKTSHNSGMMYMHRILALKGVTQCTVLEDYGILLVLADKTLYAHHVESLIPWSLESKHASTPEKISGYNEVQFFSAGMVHGRTFVIYVRKKGRNNIIRAIEAVQVEWPEVHTTSTGSRFNLRRTNSKSLFNSFKDFEIASEPYDLMFFMDKMVLMCTNGFQIIDLMNLESEIVPRQENPRYAQLVDRWEFVKPLGVIRVTDEEFLLCYTGQFLAFLWWYDELMGSLEFGLYVNNHGDPSRTTASIEWEGTAERVAFYESYVLLFDSCFIEIRQIHTGHLVQIIRGKNISCFWNGTSIHSSAANKDEKTARENRVYGVMTEIDSVSERSFQRIFELVSLDSRKL